MKGMLMIATYTEPRITEISFDDAVAAMRWAMSDPNFSPDTNQLSLALAKNALETGRWRKMYNWNFGNVKAGETWVGMFTAFPCGEELADGSWRFTPEGVETCVAGPKKGTVRQPRVYKGPPEDYWHPQTRFRAHASLFDGAQCYVDVLQTRFPSAWNGLLTGDPAKFVSALKRARYFTADEEPYLRGVASLQREFAAKLQGMPHEEVIVDDGLYARIEAEHARFFASIWDSPSGELNS